MSTPPSNLQARLLAAIETARVHAQPFGPAFQSLVRQLRAAVIESYGRNSEVAAELEALVKGNFVDKMVEVGGRAAVPGHSENANYKAREGARLDEITSFVRDLPTTRAAVPLLDGRLTFIQAVGAGVYGQVWIAVDGLLDRRVAVKLFDPDEEPTTALHHARALARVDHARVVRVHDIGRVKHPEHGLDVDAVIMQLLDGRTLHERLHQGLLTPNEVVRIADDVLDGMDAIHHTRTAHGDLHDENVIIHTDGHATVLDIMYRGTLAALPTVNRDQRFRTDVDSVHYLICQLLMHGDVPVEAVGAFRDATTEDRSLGRLRTALLAALGAGPAPAPGDWKRSSSTAARARRYLLARVLEVNRQSPAAQAQWTDAERWGGDRQYPFAMPVLVQEAEWLNHEGLIDATIAGDGTIVHARILPPGRDVAEALAPEEPSVRVTAPMPDIRVKVAPAMAAGRAYTSRWFVVVTVENHSPGNFHLSLISIGLPGDKQLVPRLDAIYETPVQQQVIESGDAFSLHLDPAEIANAVGGDVDALGTAIARDKIGRTFLSGSVEEAVRGALRGNAERE